ncbi:hypothetical protein [Brevundimonas sp. GCM10030266]|uniref:hypothetical protein n=1 Tax=Brevundimonas sp. GCM10030266 TaxID=3273386 RepID=UPI003606C88B
MIISALAFAAVLAAGDPDEVVTTAPATVVDLTASARPVAPSAEGAARQAVEQQAHGLTTDQQIDRWISSRNPEAVPYASDDLREPEPERRVRGELIAGIGTGGYRDYGVSMTMPLGETGALGFSYRKVENGYGYGYGYGPYGLDHGYPYFNDSGYAFPGRRDPEAALEHERRLSRPGGLPRGSLSPFPSVGSRF